MNNSVGKWVIVCITNWIIGKCNSFWGIKSWSFQLPQSNLNCFSNSVGYLVHHVYTHYFSFTTHINFDAYFGFSSKIQYSRDFGSESFDSVGCAINLMLPISHSCCYDVPSGESIYWCWSIVNPGDLFDFWVWNPILWV